MFEGLKDVGKLLKDAKQMKSQMKEIQDELKSAKVIGKSKNALVVVEMTGELVITKVDIDDSLLTQADVLKKSVMEACNDAAEKSKKLATGRLSHLSKGLNLPGM
ncbi:MAG: YbaB/EbfC family nucleoid-associated protein [bacterium]